MQTIRYGLRQLRRNPGFAVVAILTLALGIGANTAIFSVLDGVVLKPLPYRAPDRLYMLFKAVPARHLDWEAPPAAAHPCARSAHSVMPRERRRCTSSSALWALRLSFFVSIYVFLNGIDQLR